MTTIETIKATPVYQEILKDSFGGVMYNVANRGKYDADHILYLWLQLTPSERESAGGIIKGVFDFLTEKEV